jgi:hypothetical protein
MVVLKGFLKPPPIFGINSKEKKENDEDMLVFAPLFSVAIVRM